MEGLEHLPTMALGASTEDAPIPAKNAFRTEFEPMTELVDAERQGKLNAAALALYEKATAQPDPDSNRYAVYYSTSFTDPPYAPTLWEVTAEHTDALERVAGLMQFLLTLKNVGIAKIWYEEQFTEFDEAIPADKRKGKGVISGNARRLPADGVIPKGSVCKFYVTGSVYDALPKVLEETDGCIAKRFEEKVQEQMRKTGTTGYDNGETKVDVDELAKHVAAGGLAPESVPIASLVSTWAENSRAAMFDSGTA